MKRGVSVALSFDVSHCFFLCVCGFALIRYTSMSCGLTWLEPVCEEQKLQTKMSPPHTYPHLQPHPLNADERRSFPFGAVARFLFSSSSFAGCDHFTPAAADV